MMCVDWSKKIKFFQEVRCRVYVVLRPASVVTSVLFSDPIEGERQFAAACLLNRRMEVIDSQAGALTNAEVYQLVKELRSEESRRPKASRAKNVSTVLYEVCLQVVNYRLGSQVLEAHCSFYTS